MVPEIAAEFLKYAGRDYHGSSPLYERLAPSVAGDPDLIEIASHGHSQIPNLFFAAVQYLLIRTFSNEPLAQYYSSLQTIPNSDHELFPTFRDFCIRHRTELIETISTRLVQTNEVSRCAYLYPAFATVSKLVGNAPLAMLDLGTSAGLHLRWDKYAYDYGAGRMYGEVGSPVTIKSELRGNRVPELNVARMRIASRIGIDLRPIRPDEQDEIKWLEALIWPEHEWRRRLLRKAVSIAEQEQSHVTLLAGDIAAILPTVLDSLPKNVIPCVFQTHTWRDLSDGTKSRLAITLEKFGARQQLFFISALGQLTLKSFAPAERRTWTLANCEQHGRWIEWLAGNLRDS